MPFRSLGASFAALVLVSCAPDEAPTGNGLAGTSGGVANVRSKVGTPILGGTVAVVGGGDFAVVSDPDRDLIHIVDLKLGSVRGTVRLTVGSQPTRAVEDNRGLIRVALRGSGQVATVGLADASLRNVTSVCAEPRGLAWDSARTTLLVACAGGELVSLPSTGSTSVRRLGEELRDVVVRNGQVQVSTFRSATLLTVEDRQVRSTKPPSISLPPVRDQPAAFVPTVAWRTLAGPGETTVMIHQRSVEGDIDTIRTGLPPVAVPYYRNPCDSAVVRSAVTVIDGKGSAVSSFEVPGILPVDAALSPDGTELAIVNPGNLELTRVTLSQTGTSGGICGPVSAATPPLDNEGRLTGPWGQPVGVAFTPAGALIVHSRDPSVLVVVPPRGATNQTIERITLSSDRLDGPGAQLFHTSPGGLACASCHPEGREDGHVWTFFGKARRTQTLSGGLSQTAPFHWKGDLGSLGELVDDTFVARMGGAAPTAEQISSLTRFLDSLSAPPAPSPASPVDMTKGRAAFDAAGCNSCHSGSSFTNSSTTSVGTGEAFQVPSLKGVSRRGPWMHDGCAKTLAQRLTDPTCGGSAHGDLTALTPAQRDDLLSYLGQL